MPPLLKRSTTLLLALYSSFLVMGLMEGVAAPDAMWPFAAMVTHSFLIVFLMFFWCGAHAEENKLTPPAGAKLLSALMPPLGVPFYFMAGYGLKSGTIKLIKSLFFVALCQVTYLASLSLLQHS